MNHTTHHANFANFLITGWTRDCSKESLGKLEVQMLLLNLIGSLLFLLGYIVEYRFFADNHEDLYIWLVATPLTIGSVFFLICSWMKLMMWKQQNFGLGFAKHIFGRSHVVVDVPHQLMTLVYIGCITMQWKRLGICFAYNWGYYHDNFILDIVFKLLVYHCIMLMWSAIHTTPARYPYYHLIWSVRLICIYAFFGDAYLLRKESIDLSGHH